MLLLRIFILLVGAHAYVFLSGLIYHYLERPVSASKAESVEWVVEQYLVNMNRPKKSKQEVVQLVKDAFAKDENIRIRREFSSLWKCYLFSLTSITTIGRYQFLICFDRYVVCFAGTGSILPGEFLVLRESVHKLLVVFLLQIF